MNSITVTVDSAQVETVLNRLNDHMAHPDPMLNSIGHTVNEHVRLTFRELKSPDGVSWQRLSPVTVSRRRGRSANPLNDTGVLRDSIAYQLSGTAVEIGTNAPQAAMMNFGGTKAQFNHLWGDIPARPFMPMQHLPVTWEQDVVDVVKIHLGI
jgi:phage virion morphogenesis protein